MLSRNPADASKVKLPLRECFLLSLGGEPPGLFHAPPPFMTRTPLLGVQSESDVGMHLSFVLEYPGDYVISDDSEVRSPSLTDGNAYHTLLNELRRHDVTSYNSGQATHSHPDHRFRAATNECLREH
jgi:hypothetical protein